MPPRIISRRTLIPGPKYRYDELTVQAESGKVRTRQVVAHPGAVVVVPILDDGRLVLIRNFRVAVGQHGQWVLEFCAGTLDKAGEDPAACAERELVEECGYRARTITPLLKGDGEAGCFYTTPGLTSERMYPFAATGLACVGQRLEEDETIEVVLMTPADVWSALDTAGRPASSDRTLMDAKSIVALTIAARRGLVRI